MQGERLDERIPEYWSWFAVSLFLLVTVDMITTVFAARVYGVATELNPLVQWALERGAVTLAVMNLLAVVLVAVFFYALIELLHATQPKYRRPFAYLIEVFIGLLLFVGLAVFANNLAVIVLGGSLL